MVKAIYDGSRQRLSQKLAAARGRWISPQLGYPYSPIRPSKSVQSIEASKKPIRLGPYDSYRY